ncbi:MAG: hypothetical protein H0W24_08015 [Lysobacter sp.]|nr:hypothetical protein [Lysobacter sp.]MDQ3270520.1 hypothetical protein [Pseudomonadota bacterium]
MPHLDDAAVTDGKLLVRKDREGTQKRAGQSAREKPGMETMRRYSFLKLFFASFASFADKPTDQPSR